jgi:hypothetical protein
VIHSVWLGPANTHLILCASPWVGGHAGQSGQKAVEKDERTTRTSEVSVASRNAKYSDADWSLRLHTQANPHVTEIRPDCAENANSKGPEGPNGEMEGLQAWCSQNICSSGTRKVSWHVSWRSRERRSNKLNPWRVRLPACLRDEAAQ